MELGTIYCVAFQLMFLRQLDGSWVPADDKFLATTRQFMSQGTACKFVEHGEYVFDMEDGRRAVITAQRINEAQRNRLVRESDGFCGCEWMVDSIVKHGKIIGLTF